MTDSFPSFAEHIPDNGYCWWYLDAVSDDQQHAITIIAMLGNVFSPYYAQARRKADADPLQYCAMNVVLYHRDKNKRWAMTERPKVSVQRNPKQLIIGPSSLQRDGNRVVYEINELTVPYPSRLQGQVSVELPPLSEQAFQLDTDGYHHWRPLAPMARARVSFHKPDINWDGHAYFDYNQGERPLEKDFIYWDWSRTSSPEGWAGIHYDVTRRDGSRSTLHLKIDQHGQVADLNAGEYHALPGTLWRMQRGTFSDGGPARVVKTLEDTPFYTRSLLETYMNNQKHITMHESLSLDRFNQRWIQSLLPFRMPRKKYRLG